MPPPAAERLLPFLTWPRQWAKHGIRGDLLAGLTVALVLIPQSLAYAQLGSLPPYVGLYAALLPALVGAPLASAQTPPSATETKPAAANEASPTPAPQPPAKAAEDTKPAAAETKPAAANVEPPTPAPQPPAPPPKPALAVDGGTGAFAQAYRDIVLMPLEGQSGTHIAIPGKDGAGEADVMILDAAELDRGCRDGKLAELDFAKLDPDSTKQPARDDFLEGAVKPCGLAQMAWSALFVFDPAKLSKRPPKTVADVQLPHHGLAHGQKPH